MASSHLSLLCTLTTILLVSSMNSPVESAAQFKVGDAFGWQQPPPNKTAFYTQWAATNRFHISDSLVFEYKNDSVVSVDKWDYYHCDASDPITIFNNGNSTINLDQPGSFYFISGIYEHCMNGQKLMLQVISPMSASAPSPSSHLHHHSSASSSSLSVVLITTCFSFMLFINALDTMKRVVITDSRHQSEFHVHMGWPLVLDSSIDLVRETMKISVTSHYQTREMQVNMDGSICIELAYLTRVTPDAWLTISCGGGDGYGGILQGKHPGLVSFISGLVSQYY